MIVRSPSSACLLVLSLRVFSVCVQVSIYSAGLGFKKERNLLACGKENLSLRLDFLDWNESCWIRIEVRRGACATGCGF
jgi:hypothetical protein